jgi:prepilin signal peptidase PulO-like enzyme (type II secretory pathway)
MCPSCKHTLAWYDLVPVFSWLSLGGKCRYCKAPISKQYPLVELLTGALFVVSYIVWPLDLGEKWVLVGFVTWLIVMVGLIALAVYDAKYLLLPNRIVYPLIYISLASLAAQFMLGRAFSDVWLILAAIAVASGVFWVIYQLSNGAWIGGGDIKLGLLAGLLLATPVQAFLYLFLASVLGLLYSLPLMATKRLTKSSKVPFGPFLIASLIIVVLWGERLANWYSQTMLGL